MGDRGVYGATVPGESGSHSGIQALGKDLIFFVQFTLCSFSAVGKSTFFDNLKGKS